MPSSAFVPSLFRDHSRGLGKAKKAIKGKPALLALTDGEAGDQKEEPPTEEEKVGKAKSQLKSAEGMVHKLHTELENILHKVQHALFKKRIGQAKSWLAFLEKCEPTLKASMKKTMTLQLLEKVLEYASTVKFAKAAKKELKRLEEKASSVRSARSKGSKC